MNNTHINGTGGILALFDGVSFDIYNCTVFNYSSTSFPLFYFANAYYFSIIENKIDSVQNKIIIHINEENPHYAQKYLIGNNITNVVAYSEKGGALSLAGANNITIYRNLFENITFFSDTNQQGGAIYIEDDSRFINIIENTFRHCKATIGGALRWTNYLPHLLNNVFEENFASVYGNDIASYGVGMEFRSYEQLPLVNRKLQSEWDNFSSFKGIQSSGTIGELYLVFLDYDGQVVTSSSDDPIGIELISEN